MFTGLVQSLGRITRADRAESGTRMAIETPLAAELRTGDSIAVNGVCLTATEVSDDGFVAEAMNETVARTSLDELREGAEVNLELPLRPGDRLGGHVVQGHVDGVGTVVGLSDDGFARMLEIEAPPELLRYVVQKGSIAVDGVSLTVVSLDNGSFTVSLIPETLHRTNLGRAESGARVNLEVDVFAKYVEKLVRSPGGQEAGAEVDLPDQTAGPDGPRGNPSRSPGGGGEAAAGR
jgi:riboflavin synthase